MATPITATSTTVSIIASGPQTAALAAKAAKAANLSDLADPSAARTNIGLGNVDNTSDANKPVSTATQTALDAKQATATLQSTVAGYVGTGGALDTGLDARYASRRRARAAATLGRLAESDVGARVMTSPPTMAYSATVTTTAGLTVGAQGEDVSVRGSAGAYNGTFGALVLSLKNTVALDFVTDAAVVEVGWRCESSNADRVWLWVDGEPATAAPVTPLATSTGSSYFGLFTFPAAARRRITFYASSINGFHDVRVASGYSIQPAPRQPRIAFVGDSFYSASAGVGSDPMRSIPAIAARTLGAEAVQAGVGGSGYVAGGAFTFGAASRVAAVAATDPDLIVFCGSVNDDGLAGIQAAATACFDAYAAACPGVPMLVLGPQPTTATGTLSANRQANVAAVKAAADAHDSVLAFHDLIGTAAGVPSAWSSGATYNEGDRVTYAGSVWQWANGGIASNQTNPMTGRRWLPMTWGYTGTGQVGSTAGDGTRDTYLHSDGTHPTDAGSLALANRTALVIRRAIEQFAA